MQGLHHCLKVRPPERNRKKIIIIIRIYQHNIHYKSVTNEQQQKKVQLHAP